MATIVFSNGQKVNFEGNPTPQDVEEVAIKLGLQGPKPVTPTPAPTTTQSIQQGVGKSIIGGVQTAGNVFSKFANFVTDGATKAMNATFGEKNVIQPNKLPENATFLSDPKALDYKNTTEEISGEVTSLVGQLLVAPQVAVEKLGFSGLAKLAEAGLLSEKALHSAGKFIVSKWGSRAFTVLNDFIVGAGTKEASNIATGDTGGVATAGAETAVGGAVLRPVIKGAGALVNKLSGNSIGEVATNAKNLITAPFSNIKNYISRKIGGNTAEQILATPQNLVSKLSVDEQKLWYKNQADISKQKANEMSIATKQASDQSLLDTKKQITDFNQQIGQSARDKTISLKKPAQQVMKNASAEYVSLTGEAAEGSPALTRSITNENLTNAIDNKFEYNPEIGVSLKNELGLIETTPKIVIDPKTKLPIIEAGAPPEKTLTNQQILDKAREMMQTVSKSARQGNVVYSSAEYQAMQKYSFLMNVLGDNGVDMTAANKFWKEYAPLRDRIVREVKPFDETNTQKMPFTSTMQTAEATANTSRQAASKLDAQNFINDFETRLGVPKGTITSEVRTGVEGVEKAKLAKANIEKVTTEIQAKIKADKTEALKTLTLKQYDTVRQARISKIIKTTLIGAGIWGAAKATGVDKAVLGAVKAVI